RFVDHGEGRGRARVVRGVDADLAEIERLGVVVARVVGAVGRHRALQGEGGAVRGGGRAVVIHRVADGVPGRNRRAVPLGVQGVHRAQGVRGIDAGVDDAGGD